MTSSNRRFICRLLIKNLSQDYHYAQDATRLDYRRPVFLCPNADSTSVWPIFHSVYNLTLWIGHDVKDAYYHMIEPLAERSAVQS